MPEQDNPIKVRIQHSGGSAHGARITDLETDRHIEGITHIDISFSANGDPIKAKLTVIPREIDIVADATFVNQCPCCKQEVKVNADVSNN